MHQTSMTMFLEIQYDKLNKHEMLNRSFDGTIKVRNMTLWKHQTKFFSNVITVPGKHQAEEEELTIHAAGNKINM